MSFDKIITSFQLLYQEILTFYQLDLNSVDKWKKIATLIHDNNNIIVETFLNLKKESMRKEIKLDYNSTQKILIPKIETEENLVMKTSLIITSLHLIAYDLLSKEGNYYFALNGKEEMHILKKI